LAIFPSDKKLRYLIPFGQVNQVIDYLRHVSELQDGLAAVYGDDAEKFGEWPNTYEWVYDKRWLYNFFLALRQNDSFIKTVHAGEYLKQNEPLGRVYIPTASYQEMGEWSLGADSGEEFEELLNEAKADGREEEFLPFLRGGFWRNFLTKYPESNQMHKKMLLVSRKIADASLEPKNQNAERKKKIDLARQELYKGQCNCAYWHGVFGGLYLYHLRSAVFNHLIKAESLIDEIIKGPKGWIDCEVSDFDGDGYDEAIVSNSAVSIFFDSDEGGSITELDLKSKAINVVNPLTRRKEAYHAKLLEQSKKGKQNNQPKTIHQRTFGNVSLADKVFYDWYKRACLLDHFFGKATTIDNFSHCKYEELGDFVNQPFGIKMIKNGVVLKREGQVASKSLSVTKTIELKKDSAGLISINYDIKNTSGGSLELWFGPEFNFSLTNDDVFEQLFSEKEISLKDSISGVNVRLGFSKPADLWHFPVKTISQSESDMEENYQSTVILPHWKFQLEANKSWDIDMALVF